MFQKGSWGRERFANGGDVRIAIMFIDLGTTEKFPKVFFEPNMPVITMTPTDPHEQRREPRILGLNEWNSVLDSRVQLGVEIIGICGILNAVSSVRGHARLSRAVA